MLPDFKTSRKAEVLKSGNIKSEQCSAGWGVDTRRPRKQMGVQKKTIYTQIDVQQRDKDK